MVATDFFSIFPSMWLAPNQQTTMLLYPWRFHTYIHLHAFHSIIQVGLHIGGVVLFDSIKHDTLCTLDKLYREHTERTTLSYHGKHVDNAVRRTGLQLQVGKTRALLF